jgi:ribosomal-protein-alanine N-acetyltransferase
MTRLDAPALRAFDGRRDAPATIAGAPAPEPAPRVRPGGRDDLDAVDAVMRAAFDPRFGEAWRAEQIGATLAGAGGRLLILAIGDRPPAGFSLVRAVAGEAELLLLAIAPAARRGGLGGGLLAAAMRDARSAGAGAMFLEVREDNHAARRLYSRGGFVEVGRRPGYYRGVGQRRYHAVSMRRSLCD